MRTAVYFAWKIEVSAVHRDDACRTIHRRNLQDRRIRRDAILDHPQGDRGADLDAAQRRRTELLGESGREGGILRESRRETALCDHGRDRGAWR